MSWFEAAWIVLGLLLSTASQLRPGELPVGVGEVLLAGWMISAVLLIVFRVRAPVVSGALRLVIAFWLTSLLVLSAGLLTRIWLRIDDYATGSHDALAFAFVACLSLLLAADCQAGRSRRLVVAFAAGSAVAAGLLLIAAVRSDALGPIEFWYQEIRFQGWSENPNQMSLLLCAAPFVCLQLARDSRSRLAAWLSKGAAGVLIVVGVTTASDALFVAWFAAVGLWFVLAFRKRLFARDSSPLALVCLAVILPGAVIMALIQFGGPVFAALWDLVSGLYDLGGQGSTRVAIWSHAAAAFSESPLVGLGPGAYSGYGDRFEGLEAHNSLLDWSVSAGVLGAVALAGFLAAVIARTVRAGTTMLLLAIVALVMFSMFHFVLRHPVFWAWCILIYQYAADAEASHYMAARVDPCVA